MISNESNKLLSEVVAFRTYAKYIPHLQRRETLQETTNRTMNMHLERFPKLSGEITKAFSLVHELKIMPSMRSMQFSGEAVSSNNSRSYNCSFINITYERAFSEILFLLLSGTGVGFSVQKRHVSKLPTVRKPKEEGYFRVHDSIEGWSQALYVLLDSYFNGAIRPDYDFSAIRPKGSYLVTTGAKAPGHEPLRYMLTQVDKSLANAIGRKLRPIEVHDIVCLIADCVLAGGIRRAALISLFDKSDEEMLKCKSGSWWEKYPYRARANNSVVLHRDDTTKEEFDHVLKICEESKAGEPGIFWTNDYDHGTNPCFTGETIVAVADGRNGVSIKQLAEESNGINKIQVYSASEVTYNNQFGKTDKFSHWKTEIKSAIAFKTGTKEVITVILSDGSEFKCTPDHRLATKDGRWVEAKYSEGEELAKFYSYSNKNSNKSYRHINSKTNGFAKQYRMIWEFNRGLYNSDFQIDHIDENSKNDKLENLQLLSLENHTKKSSDSKEGNNNPVFRVKNKEHYTWALKRSSILINANRYGWSQDRIDEALKNFNQNNKEPDIKDIDVILNERVFVQEIVYTGEIEDVYDLTVDDNHNFYIITKTDDKEYLNSSGVLVHNCAEISLNSNQFCNLTSINQTGVSSEKEFFKRIRAAAVIGTLQASYTNFPYLSEIWKETTEREALLGVSFTGVADAMGFVTPELLREGAKLVLQTNEELAKKIGINLAARTTCLKPEGTVSTIVGSSSGVHDRHAKYYIRRIRMNESDPLAKYLKLVIPDLVEQDIFSETGVVVSIPQESPKGSVTREQSSALSMLERANLYNMNWIKSGHRSGVNRHNCSVTISVRDDEWDALREAMWETRENYTGVALLPYDGGSYQQAPFEDIEENKFKEMEKLVKAIDLTKVREVEDFTNRGEIVACAGGVCEVSL
jgi:hypothetical protein